jgi:hypothetical protein
MVSQLMRIFAAMPAWIHMDIYVGKAWLSVEKRMAYLLNDTVTFARPKILIYRDVELCLESVPQPPDTNAVNILHLSHICSYPFNAFHHFRIHRVHQSV